MQMRYYISSANLTAEKFARSIREHYSRENRLHWCLDTAMNEDDCRIRRGNDASGIRHIVVCSEYSSARKDVQGGTTTQDEKSGNVQSLLGRGFVNLPWRHGIAWDARGRW